MKSKLMSAKEAAALIQDQSTLALCGFTMMGACEAILREIESRFLDTGHPSQLTVMHAAGHSNQKDGIEHLAHVGLTEKIIGSHWGLAPKFREMITRNEIEAHCLPQGQLTHLFRAMASGKPGNFSKVGIGTFIDPRVEGGRMNEKAKQSNSLVDVIHIQDEEYLFYNAVPLDYCLIRGTTADEDGNITMEDEALKLEAISVAQAVKRYNGKVIVQVKNIVKRGTLPAKQVVVPGIYVDQIVVAENPQETHRLSSTYFHDPVFTGDLKQPVQSFERLPLTARKIIGRRGVMELFPGAVVNLGTGIPGDVVGPVASEEGILDDIYLTVESGAIGGVPMGGMDFGITKNAEAIIDHPYQFDYYCGRGADVTYMGAAEIDAKGNVNVSRFGSRTIGCGGFIDITQNAKTIVYCFTFTAGGLDIKAENGKLEIIQEGSFSKFEEHINQITFSGKTALDNNQKVLYVTERAVFELREEGLTLTEVAPGIDIEKDIFRLMSFRPALADAVKEMPAALFHEETMRFSNDFHRIYA